MDRFDLSHLLPYQVKRRFLSGIGVLTGLAIASQWLK